MSNRWLRALSGLALVVVLGAVSLTAVRSRRDSARAPPATGLMAGSSSVAGTVTGPAGEPIGSARVCAHPSGLDVASSAVTVCSNADSKGRYTVAQLAARVYILSAYAEGFAAGSARGVPLSLVDGGSHVGVDIALLRGGATIAGTVVDATGRPLPHARVRGEHSVAPAIAMAIEADDSGRFTFSFPPGPVVLAALEETYAPARTVVSAPSEGVRLALVTEARARGVVVFAADGKPAPNVEVRAAPADHAQPFFESSTTDASGAFDIRSLEPGRYALVATGEGLRGGIREPIELRPRGTVDGLRIEVRPAAQVLARVLLEGDERPCDQGQVTLGPPDPRHPPAHDDANGAADPPVPTTIVADIEAHGVVSFLAVPPGHYHVSVDCFDHLLKQGPRVLDVGTQTLSDITWHVGRGASLHALVVDDLDRPVAQAGFALRYPQWIPGRPSVFETALSDIHGEYDTEHVLSPGVYEVMTGLPLRALPVTVEVAGGADVQVKLKFMGSSSIEIAVRDRSGNPLDGLRVFAKPAASPAGGPSAPEAPQGPPARFGGARPSSGHYRIGPLTAGRYEVQIEDGVNPAIPAGTYVLSNGESAEARIELDRDGHVQGQVLDDRGVPVANASVRAMAEPEGSAGTHAHAGPTWSEMPGRVLTDVEGRFVIDRLSSAGASYELRAEAPGHALGVVRGVKPGDGDASIALPPAGSLAGEVDDRCGNSPVRIMAVNTDSGETRTLPIPPSTRSFLLDGLSPGRLRLEAVCADNSAAASITTELSAGQKVTGLRLAFEPRSVSMSLPGLNTGAHLVQADEARGRR